MGNRAEFAFQALFGGGGDLIRHGFAGFSGHGNQRFAGVESAGIAGEGDDLNSVQVAVGDVVDDQCGACLGDFSIQRGFKVTLPDFTAPHG
ncbi:MAG: hypothetical protein WA056_11475 [Gallionella sp.]